MSKKEAMNWEEDLHALIYEDGLTSIDLILHTQAQWAQHPMYGIDELMDMFNVSVNEMIDALGDRIPGKDITFAHYTPNDYDYQQLFIDYNIHGFLAKCTFRVPCNFKFEVRGEWDEPEHLDCVGFSLSPELVGFCAFGETFIELLQTIYARDRELYKEYESKALQEYEKGGRDD